MFVGFADGEGVGARDGVGVGKEVGEGLGAELGVMVGDNDGAGTGTSEGFRVATTASTSKEESTDAPTPLCSKVAQADVRQASHAGQGYCNAHDQSCYAPTGRPLGVPSTPQQGKSLDIQIYAAMCQRRHDRAGS